MRESSVYKHLVETAGEEYYQRGRDKQRFNPSSVFLSLSLIGAQFKLLDTP